MSEDVFYSWLVLVIDEEKKKSGMEHNILVHITGLIQGCARPLISFSHLETKQYLIFMVLPALQTY